MEKSPTSAENVDSYISSFPVETKTILEKIRKLIRTSVPEAEESISYGIPTYKLYKKPLVYFAGYKSHIGFYATPSGHESIQEKLSNYKQGKGSVQFPLKQEIPYNLIQEIVLFRKEELVGNIEKN